MTDAGAKVELEATRLRRNWAWPFVALLPFLVPLGAIYSSGLSHRLAPFAFFGFFLSAFLSVHVWKNNPWPRRTTGRVVIEGDALEHIGEIVARRDEIDRVTYHRAVWSTVVRLHRKVARDVHLVVENEEAAREILVGLGFGPERSTAKFVGKSRFSNLGGWIRAFAYVAIVGTLGVLAAAVGSVTAGSGATLATLAMVLPILAALQLTSTTIEVGADALSIRWLGRTRIVPFADVLGVEATTQVDRVQDEGTLTTISHHMAVISIRGEEATTIRFGTSDSAVAERNQFIERCRQVRAARARGDEAIDTAFLTRGGRDAATWIHALRAGSAPEGGMRRAPIPPERFWRLIEDASASAVDRAAAAMAVGRSATPEQRERVRIAANTTIDPALRKAFERAVDEEAEDEAIADALEAVEKTDRARS